MTGYTVLVVGAALTGGTALVSILVLLVRVVAEAWRRRDWVGLSIFAPLTLGLALVGAGAFAMLLEATP